MNMAHVPASTSRLPPYQPPSVPRSVMLPWHSVRKSRRYLRIFPYGLRIPSSNSECARLRLARKVDRQSSVEAITPAHTDSRSDEAHSTGFPRRERALAVFNLFTHIDMKTRARCQPTQALSSKSYPFYLDTLEGLLLHGGLAHLGRMRGSLWRWSLRIP